ncbi:MAG TPA: hypothetical protein VK882_04165 [Nitrososphaeraceae archaeon]|nr:hypothetical protein [Nitrososphaeraceae archaeon]
MENKVITKNNVLILNLSMNEHGFYDPHLKKWYCSYFMDEEEWLNIHDYLPIQYTEHFYTSESSE